MEIEAIGDYTRQRVLPHVQAFLYQLYQQFSCQLTWTKTSLHPLGSTQTITAAPLDPALWLPYLTPSASGDVALGEYMWYVASGLPRAMQHSQPGKKGHIRLETSLFAALDIPKGTPEYQSEDGSVPGFLCWAERCELPDGSECYRVQTNAGLLWLRPLSQTSLIRLFYDQSSPPRGEPTVVHLAETSCHMPRLLHYSMNGPLAGYTSKDEFGRIWEINHNKLVFDALCRLNVAGRYNERLRERPTTILRPPYEAIWQPDEQDFGLPLEMVTCRT